MDEMSEPGIGQDINLDCVETSYVDETGNQKNNEEEYYDAPGDTFGERGDDFRKKKLRESFTLESKNISSDILISVQGENALDCPQKARIERKIREPIINLQQLLHNLYEVGRPSLVPPGIGRESSNKNLKIADKVLNDPKRNVYSKKEDDSAEKDVKWTRKTTAASRQRLAEKTSLGYQFKASSLKRPLTQTAAYLDGVAKEHFEDNKNTKQNESVGHRRSYSGSEYILQKKLKRFTLVNKKDDFENDVSPSSEKYDDKFCKDTIMGEVEKRMQRIGAAISNSLVDKSFSSLKHKRKDIQYFSNFNHSSTVRAHPHRRLPSTPKSNPQKSFEQNEKSILENANSVPSGASNFNHAKISLVEVRKEVSPLSSTDVTNISDDIFLSNYSISEAAVNTEATGCDEQVLTLRKEKEEYFLSNVSLTKENETLKEIITKQQKKECDLKKEIMAITEELIKTNLSLKEMENKFLEKDSTLAQLRCCVNKLHDLSERFKRKDGIVAELENKNSKIKYENNKIKKELDRRTVEQNNLNKDKESLMNLLCQLRTERDCLETKITDLTGKITEKEQEHINLLNVLSSERKQFRSLKEERDMNSSSHILNLSEQLLEKDSIISALKQLRDRIQLINKEVCCMLSSIFKELGLHRSETEIESLISNGRTSTIKNSLISLIENNCYKGLDYSHDECRNLIFNLEDRAAVLEAELEESKKYSETLAGAFSVEEIWDVKCGSLIKGELEEIECLSGENENEIGTAIGDTRNFSCYLPKNLPQNLFDLFVLLEGKQQALRKIEKRMKELEGVHSSCKQKRVRNEMRIDQLEMALATVKLQY